MPSLESFAQEILPIIKKAFTKGETVSNSLLGKFLGALWVLRRNVADNLILGKEEWEVPQLIRLREIFEDNEEEDEPTYDENSDLIQKYSIKAFTEDVPPEFNEIKKFVKDELQKKGGNARRRVKYSKKRSKRRSTKRKNKRKSMKRKSMKRNKKQIRKKTKRRRH